MNERVILIDGHSMAFRAFYALPEENFTTKSGQPTNAVYGFTSALITIMRTWQPTRLAVAFDVSRHTFRTDEYADYKGTRAKTPPSFPPQIDLIKQVLSVMGLTWLEKDNFEADDIIATLSKQASYRGWETLIISGDRDSFQLIDEHTNVLYPKRGVSELARMDPAAVEDKYGVTPQRYPELAALVGETSDNLPGVPGVGPKTAAKWLKEYDGLDNLLDRADSIKGKAGQSLRDHLDDVRRNRRLNALLRDMELEVGVDDLGALNLDREKMHSLFDVLEFKTLRERLVETDADSVVEVASPSIEVIADEFAPSGLEAWLSTYAAEGAAIHCLGDWGSGAGDISALAVAAGGHSLVIEPAELNPADDAAWRAWLANPSVPKTMHSAKGQMLAMWQLGWKLKGLVCDTELAAYLLHPDNRSYELGELATRYLHKELSTGSETLDAQPALSFGLTGEQKAQLRYSAQTISELTVALDDALNQAEASYVFTVIEMPAQRVLARMEKAGICVDLDRLGDLRADFAQKVSEAQEWAIDLAGHPVNLASPKQLQKVLFDELNLPKTKKIRTGYTTGASALEALYRQTEHPFLEALLAYRDVIKLQQSTDGLIKAICDDGRIHTTFLQTMAATGRLSSIEPNLQNIPVRTEQGRQIRSAFIAGQGYEGLISADYSQIEMRVMAHICQDEHLVEAFCTGVDFHTMTAAKVYQIPIDEVTPAQRAGVKQVNYGLAYGLSAYGLSERMAIPVGAAQRLIDDYLRTFGKVHDYLNEVVDKARCDGYTTTIFGRRRYLPELNSSNRRVREMAERAALNAPIQGSAADIIKVAMIHVDDALRSAGLASRILLQIHDELIVEVAPGEKDQVIDVLTEQMSTAVQLDVPLDVSFGYGNNWLEAAH